MKTSTSSSYLPLLATTIFLLLLPSSRTAVLMVEAFSFRPSISSSLKSSTDLKATSTNDDCNDCRHGMLDRRSAIFLGTAAGLATTTSSILYPPLPGLAAVADGDSITTTTTKNVIPEWTLENDVKMPTLALNTVGLSSEETTKALEYAYNVGITHVDFHPGKERDGVAAYLAKYGNIRRDKLFLNTKIRKAPPGTSPEDAAFQTKQQIDDDLKVLNVKYVDMLMLRDSPDCNVIQSQWNVLEQGLLQGKTRSIGVINFCQSALECVLTTAKIKPSLNYYMLHVGMGQDAHGLRTFCDKNNIRTFAYGAVGEPGPNPELLNSKILQRIGDSHGGKTPEEVALRWVLQTGAAVSVRPTTNFGLGMGVCVDPTCQDGIARRANSFNWSLTKQEMRLLNSLTTPDDNPTLFSSKGCPNSFVMPSASTQTLQPPKQ